jgi:hypothetical protein
MFISELERVKAGSKLAFFTFMRGVIFGVLCAVSFFGLNAYYFSGSLLLDSGTGESATL